MRGINGGVFFFVNLPGSGIKVDLPLIACWSDALQMDAGVKPNVEIRPSAADLRAGADRAMAHAITVAIA